MKQRFLLASSLLLVACSVGVAQPEAGPQSTQATEPPQSQSAPEVQPAAQPEPQSPEDWARAQLVEGKGDGLISKLQEMTTYGDRSVADIDSVKMAHVMAFGSAEIMFRDRCEQARAKLVIVESAIEHEYLDEAYDLLMEMLNPMFKLKRTCRDQYDRGYTLLGKIGFKKLKSGDVEGGTALITSAGLQVDGTDPQATDRLLISAAMIHPDQAVASQWAQAAYERAGARDDFQIEVPVLLAKHAFSDSRSDREFVAKFCVAHAASVYGPFETAMVWTYASSQLLDEPPRGRYSRWLAEQAKAMQTLATATMEREELGGMVWGLAMTGLAIREAAPEVALRLTSHAIELLARLEDPPELYLSRIRQAHATVCVAAGVENDTVPTAEPFEAGFEVFFYPDLERFVDLKDTVPTLILRFTPNTVAEEPASRQEGTRGGETGG